MSARRPRTLPAAARVSGPLAALALLAGLGAGSAAAQGRVSEEEREANCREGAPRLAEALAETPAPTGAVVVYTFKETFCPRVVEVAAGTRLHVVNVEKRTSHSIWFQADGRGESERFLPGESVDVTLDLALGEHVYVCGPHPWMNGRVVITEGKR